MLSSKGNKGYAFGNGIMSYADGTGEGPSQAEGPSPEGPLAEEHKPQLIPASGQDMHCTASRGPDASAETCEKVPAGRFSASGSDRNAHTASSRGHEAEKSTEASRTYSDSRITCRPNDESKNRPGGSHFVWV